MNGYYKSPKWWENENALDILIEHEEAYPEGLSHEDRVQYLEWLTCYRSMQKAAAGLDLDVSVGMWESVISTNTIGRAILAHSEKIQVKYLVEYHRWDPTRLTDEYMTFRENVLERDNYRCVRCGRKKNLEVHHLIPVNRCKAEGLEHLITDPRNADTLCHRCHAIIHPWMKGIKASGEG